ncbi:MAG TPA: sensor histidine kinase [Trebonia sp.]|nr:sensor histidine kinase [Trebonia sp.]
MASTDCVGKRPPYVTGYPSRRAKLAGIFFTGVWLVYLIGGVAYLFSHHYSALYIAGGMTIIVVFCVLYLVLVPHWATPPRYTLPGLAVLALLAVLACLFYGPTGLVALWIFMSSASGLLVQDGRWAVRAVAVCVACYLIFGWTTHLDSTDYLSNLLPVIFIGLAMIGMRRQFRLTAELARAREEVAQLAANEERLRLARDMHDLTGQSLSTITLKSELAARLLGRLPDGAERDRARDEIEQVAAVSRQTLRDIREAISGYRRPTLAVEVITARAALASAGIAARDDADLTLLSGTFDPDAEAALAWCLREAVTNVVRHSGARNCRIGLTRRSGTVSLTVRDDGAGHLPPASRDPLAGFPAGPAGTGQTGRGDPGRAAGTGLHGMAERLSAVGGSLELSPDARPGFRLVATVPETPAGPAGRPGPPGSAAQDLVSGRLASRPAGSFMTSSPPANS